ncbi:MAG: hypothetical protein ABIQ04_01440 [Candidatus Saccharimonadales bacterium]
MMDRLLASSMQSYAHLPPPDAWKEPDKWLSPDNRQKFYAPIDDRGFVLPDDTVETVLDLFHDDYEWPYDKDDPTTKPDDHHFHWEMDSYLPVHHLGSTIPMAFRELATNRGLMPRQFHNVIHHVTYEPEIPDLSDMEQYLRSYVLAKHAFLRLFATAKQAVTAQRTFSVRRQDILEHPDRIKGDYDEVGEAFHAQQFNKYFTTYQQLILATQNIPSDNPVFSDIDRINRRLKPHHAVKILGLAATRKYVNFVPLIVGKAA